MQFMLHLQLPLHGFSNLQASNNRSQNQQKLLCWTLNTCYDSLEKKILMFISYSLIWKWFFSKFSQQTWTPLISASPCAATVQSAAESHGWVLVRRLQIGLNIFGRMDGGQSLCISCIIKIRNHIQWDNASLMINLAQINAPPHKWWRWYEVGKTQPTLDSGDFCGARTKCNAKMDWHPSIKMINY